MSQAQDIINTALKHIGVLSSGMTAATEEYTDCLEQLNSMLSTWDVKRLNIFAIQEQTQTLTGGKQSYTIGTEGSPDFNTARPISIRAANIVSLTGGFYFPLRLITAEEFAAIPERNNQAHIPRLLYYDNNYPLATIYLHPIPSDASTLELFTWEQLSSFAALSTTFDMPPAYQNAVEYALALQVAPMFGRTVSEELAAQAAAAMQAVQMLNLPPEAGQAEEGQARTQVSQMVSPAGVPEAVQEK